MPDTLSLENHWLACMASAGGGGRVTRLGPMLTVIHPRLSPAILNFMLLRDARPDDLPVLLEAGGAALAEWGRPPALFLSPASGDMGALGTVLSSLGWRLRTHQTVLVRQLTDLDLPAPTEGVSVREIGTQELRRWGDLLVKAYEVAPGVGQEIRAAWTALHESPGESAAARFYLGSVGGAPVGTGLTWIRSGIAGLYCGAVLPAARRRGVERATVLRRLADAAATGAYAAFLQTEEGSPVEHLCLNRLGFEKAHSRELWIK